jgi:hypothetical protein
MMKLNEKTIEYLLRKWEFLLKDTPHDKRIITAWLLENQCNGLYSDNEQPISVRPSSSPRKKANDKLS